VPTATYARVAALALGEDGVLNQPFNGGFGEEEGIGHY
jgi:hypothetical protein